MLVIWNIHCQINIITAWIIIWWWIVLIVVIGIIAITSTIGVAAMDPIGQFQKANDAKIKADLSQIQKALEQYYEDNGKYPASDNNLIKKANGDPVAWGAVWDPYMNILPKSPYSASKYAYYSPLNSSGQTYYLYASLERKADPDLCNTNGDVCGSIAADMGVLCGKVCNYGVSSQNVSPWYEVQS